MYFDKLIGLKERNGQDIITRQAVRAISIRDDKILMVASNQGDYKLPGGGIKKNETHEEALSREIVEETGYRCRRVSSMIGKVLERKMDMYEKDKIFEMTSYYYVCEVSNDMGEQSLDGYEIELAFKPIWISINEAILKNIEFQMCLNKDDIWTQRENYVLAKIESMGIRELLAL
ncbi:NUDIX domain-containing protein [Brassicibacter mesophilus]|uniref:NUDIX domain-containing protein n=1 Tax=Brassicibacter mesophilus TaxID=745119 RepID=UPI003D1FFB43